MLDLIRRCAVPMLAALTVAASPAHAVPSYARQTGSDCASCHVGGFGPQLTPYGVQFKIGGYTDSDGKAGQIPLSAMLVANATRTRADATEAVPHFKVNDNTAIQEVSLFLAGRLGEHVGAFAQSTYSGVDRKWAFDQLDLRYARSLRVSDTDLTAGVSLNSNPTLTDPMNTLGQWRFPYTASDFGAGTGPAPLVESLASTVLGLNAYTLVARHWYAELGLYNTLSGRGLRIFNSSDPGVFKGLGTYARLAYLQDNKRDNWSVGLVGFQAALQPDRTQLGTADRYRDWGIDGSYQWLGNREHVFTASGSWMHERQRLDFSQAQGAASASAGSLNSLRLATSYHWRQTWGASLARFDVRGSADAERWGAVSHVDRPDTRGWIVQTDWTPWGKDGSWGAPWANVRLGLQYTAYGRFNGGARYIDEATGADRAARDNNTTMVFVWVAL